MGVDAADGSRCRLRAKLPGQAGPDHPRRASRGAADATARVVAPRLGDLLGQQIILEPRPGANNNIATEYVARAQPDGYTLLWGFSGALVVNPALYSNLSFNILKDFEPIILIGFTPTVLVVHNSVAANSVPELVALVKSSKPGQFQYSSGGSGSPNHLAAALFTSRAGIDIIHVPYKGGGPAVLALLSGEVKMLFATPASVMGHIESGRIKALAVTAPRRSAEAPNIPTMQESGYPGFDVRAWFGLVAPAKTPNAIVMRVNQDMQKVLSMPDVQQGLRKAGLDIAGGTPEELAAHIKSETALWAKVIKDAGIKPD